MTSPEDSNLGQRWWTANLNIPTQRRGAVGFPRLQAREDVNPDAEVGDRVTVRVTDARENVAFAEVVKRSE
nr:TRAM domain-containing protein [Salinigranum marinum]